MNLKGLLIVLFTFGGLLAEAQQTISPVKMQWKVGDTTREALVYLPPDAKTKPSALIFDFHGHGGTMAFAYRKFSIQKVWPEAILVCPQGLNTPGQLTDKEGEKPGWQKGKGDMGDRDLKFFDVMLASLKKDYKVDDKRIYVTGHSNGGHFTYLLWAERGDVFAAVAPCAAAAMGLVRSLKPKPCFHLMGEKDPLVKPEWQKITINAVLRLNSCADKGVPTGKYTTWYKSATGNPVVLYVHPGGHEYPVGASQAITDFFKQCSK
ncbi:alpha/beta hydrolase family esterase [Pedobacter sp. BS3]|uniref:alpha/beta hydrolase family esterase n=1 Tax=Pedobacter sp. BS3 TaxID=2567937 RepID=UPI0018D77466|nr:prolyl oligopeptidase family serine peptidase [Pedobacter sp. BS3]